MSKVEEYLQGWMTDDLDMVQDACAEDFVYDDPYDGRITKAQFPENRRPWSATAISTTP